MRHIVLIGNPDDCRAHSLIAEKECVSHKLPENMHVFYESQTVGLHNGYCFISGGYQNKSDKSGVTKISILYDPAQNICSYLKSMNRARYAAAIVLKDGFVYCLGGVSAEGKPMKECERYNLRANRWEELAPMNFARAYATAQCYGNSIYVCGG